MKTSLIQSFVLLSLWHTLLVQCSNEHKETFQYVYTVDEILNLFNKGWTIFGNESILQGAIAHRAQVKLFNVFKTITSKMDQLEWQLHAVTEGVPTISNIIDNLPERVRLELRSNSIVKSLNAINDQYQSLQTYINETDNQQEKLKDFAQKIVSPDPNSIQNLVEKMHLINVPTEGYLDSNTGLLALISDYFKNNAVNAFANLQHSPQQVIYNVFTCLFLTDLKGYTLINFAYMMRMLYKDGNFTKEMDIARKRYEVRSSSLLLHAKKYMESSSRQLWIPDPKHHQSNVTYTEITELLQGFLVNEVDLNEQGQCFDKCSIYQYTKVYGCYQNQYCSQQRKCNGKIVNCKFFESDMSVCPAEPNTNRRYRYIEGASTRALGRNTGCKTDLVSVKSWWRWLFWHCSYCVCLCDEMGPQSHRYISLRSSVANIQSNRVMVGMRFIKSSDVIHLQIQEGELLPNADINQTTVQWVPIQDFNIKDKKIKRGQDYHTLSWEKRSIDLDDIELKANHLATGIRFKMIGSHLHLQIYSTPFNFTTGKLLNALNTSIFEDNSQTDASNRTKVHLYNPDVSTRSLLPSIPDSNNGQYIEFVNSDLDRDVAQTTVPFIDIQQVVSIRAIPLSGAGIYHKGRRSFGGYIAPKIITYDFNQHLGTLALK